MVIGTRSRIAGAFVLAGVIVAIVLTVTLSRVHHQTVLHTLDEYAYATDTDWTAAAWPDRHTAPQALVAEAVGSRIIPVQSLGDQPVTLHVHSNTADHPVVLPSCQLRGLVVRDGGYVLVESDTHVRFESLVVCRGGVLQVRGQNIELECTRPDGELRVTQTGTLSLEGAAPASGPSPSFVPVSTDHLSRGATEIRVPLDTPWSAGESDRPDDAHGRLPFRDEPHRGRADVVRLDGPRVRGGERRGHR